MSELPPEYHYHLLRAASEQFHAAIATLTPEQFTAAERQAKRTWELETRVLNAPEAQSIVITATQVHHALAALQARYPTVESFHSDLANNQLTVAAVQQALARELQFDATLQQISANCPPVTAQDEQQFYTTHHNRFATPERRTVRQILITLNDDYPENQRPAALARLTALREQLIGADAATFGQIARRHSECPSALEDGHLGSVSRTQLYPELEQALFALAEGDMSAIIESPLGLHVLLCERIYPAVTPPLPQVRSRIQAFLTKQRRQQYQRAWIARLQE